MTNPASRIKHQKYYDLIRDENGNERTVFSHMTIETDGGTFVMGNKCKKCGSAIVPRTMKIDGQYKTKPYCPSCKD